MPIVEFLEDFRRRNKMSQRLSSKEAILCVQIFSHCNRLHTMYIGTEHEPPSNCYSSVGGQWVSRGCGDNLYLVWVPELKDG